MDRIYTYQDLKYIQTFIYSLKRQAKTLGVELILDSNQKYIIMGDDEDDVKSSGYFDAHIKILKGTLGVGTKRPINDWLPILVHESCHMDQWNEGISLWKDSEKLTYNIFGDWLKDKRCNKKEAFKCIDILKNLELDCEKRSVEKIKKYKLPIDIKEYIQKANSYIFFYNYMKKTRRWVEGELLNKPEVLSVISNEWYESYDETPRKIEAMFKKYKI